MAYVCLDCGCTFNDPEFYTNTHGFSHGPYEEWHGCPSCSGAYTIAYECDCCGEIIQSNYVKIGDKRYCDNCFLNYELGEED